MMEQLIESGVTAFQVSLDGPKQFHDKTRILANNSGSYDRLMENMIALRNSDLLFRIVLRIHVTPINLPHMPEFVSELARTFDDSRFAILFQTIEHLGGPNDTTFDVVRQNKADILEQLYSIVAQHSQNMISRKIDEDYVCYASRANAFVIRSTGSIGKCTVALDDDRNVVGSIMEDGRVRLDAEKIKPWIRGVETLDFAVLGCPAAGFLHNS
jgi:uncharacterized protein